MRVAIYRSSNRRSHNICQAMAQGIGAVGDQPTIIPVGRWGEVGPESEAAVYYGMREPFKTIHAAYIEAGKPAVYIDLGYWHRHLPNVRGGRWLGYHKIVVSALHATDYFQRRLHGATRWNHLGTAIRPRRVTGRSILVAGMSGKAAMTNGLRPEEFERRIITELRRVTERPIVYRPKPSWEEAQPIEGTEFSRKSDRLDQVLAGTWAVVTHHSNVACDAIIDGVPLYCVEGIGSVASIPDLALIDTPRFPDREQREQWAWDAAYCQWNLEEMRDGTAWRYLRDEGLV